MKILSIDIERLANVAETWELWNQNISPNQIVEPGRVICWAAKWVGTPGVIFRSEFHHGFEPMLQKAWELVDEADAVLGYNSDRFDLLHLNTEWLLMGLEPPSPVRKIDLLKVMRRMFKMPSNKLDYVAQRLGLPAKKLTGGHGLWVGCRAGDPKAWSKMRTYNKHDAVLNELVYDKVKLWIPGHPHVGLYEGQPDCCPLCGSTERQRRGETHNRTASYPRFRCLSCGKWYQGTKSVARVNTGGTA